MNVRRALKRIILIAHASRNAEVNFIPSLPIVSSLVDLSRITANHSARTSQRCVSRCRRSCQERHNVAMSGSDVVSNSGRRGRKEPIRLLEKEKQKQVLITLKPTRSPGFGDPFLRHRKICGLCSVRSRQLCPLLKIHEAARQRVRARRRCGIENLITAATEATVGSFLTRLVDALFDRCAERRRQRRPNALEEAYALVIKRGLPMETERLSWNHPHQKKSGGCRRASGERLSFFVGTWSDAPLAVNDAAFPLCTHGFGLARSAVRIPLTFLSVRALF